MRWHARTLWRVLKMHHGVNDLIARLAHRRSGFSRGPSAPSGSSHARVICYRRHNIMETRAARASNAGDREMGRGQTSSISASSTCDDACRFRVLLISFGMWSCNSFPQADGCTPCSWSTAVAPGSNCTQKKHTHCFQTVCSSCSVCAATDAWGSAEIQPPIIGTRILGRRTALFTPFLIYNRVPHGFTPKTSYWLRSPFVLGRVLAVHRVRYSRVPARSVTCASQSSKKACAASKLYAKGPSATRTQTIGTSFVIAAWISRRTHGRVNHEAV